MRWRRTRPWPGRLDPGTGTLNIESCIDELQAGQPRRMAQAKPQANQPSPSWPRVPVTRWPCGDSVIDEDAPARALSPFCLHVDQATSVTVTVTVSHAAAWRRGHEPWGKGEGDPLDLRGCFKRRGEGRGERGENSGRERGRSEVGRKGGSAARTTPDSAHRAFDTRLETRHPTLSFYQFTLECVKASNLDL